MRYFIILATGIDKEDNIELINYTSMSKKYPNRKSITHIIKKEIKSVEWLVITGIIELSKEDYEEYVR